uniref:Uncharacterized protein n=1 Tax=Noctiluca scintillans TaxID=2966 RepID=A0A7S1A505_NOCSC
MAAILLFLTLQWVDALEMVYLLLFGIILLVMDSPFFVKMSFVPDMRRFVARYANILTRAVGKGVTYFFLGCALGSGIWSNFESTMFLTIGTILTLAVIYVGLASVTFGAIKSHSLERVKKALGGAPMYMKHARMQPGLGITPEEFNNMTSTERGVVFSGSDLRLIFNALSNDPYKQAISSADFEAWARGGCVVL